jgi:hypothetical protein
VLRIIRKFRILRNPIYSVAFERPFFYHGQRVRLAGTIGSASG